MPHEVVRHACDFCKTKTYKNKSSAVRHEKQCFANPKTKACRTCKYYKEEMETVYNHHHNGDPGSTDYDIKIRYCSRGYRDLKEEPLNYNCEAYKEGTDNFI